MTADDVTDGRQDVAPVDGDASALADVLGVSLNADFVEWTPTVSEADVRLPRRAEPSERVSSVLVAVSGGPHSGATVDFARTLAQEFDSLLELFHVVTVDPGEDGDGEGEGEAEAEGEGAGEIVEAAEERLGTFDRVDRWVVEDETAAEAIVEQSSYYDIVVIGASTSGRVERFVHGSTTGIVAEEAACPVVVVTADGDSSLIGE